MQLRNTINNNSGNNTVNTRLKKKKIDTVSTVTTCSRMNIRVTVRPSLSSSHNCVTAYGYDLITIKAHLVRTPVLL